MGKYGAYDTLEEWQAAVRKSNQKRVDETMLKYEKARRDERIANIVTAIIVVLALGIIAGLWFLEESIRAGIWASALGK